MTITEVQMRLMPFVHAGAIRIYHLPNCMLEDGPHMHRGLRCVERHACNCDRKGAQELLLAYILSGRSGAKVHTFGSLVVDENKHEVTWRGKRLRGLLPTIFNILAILAEAEGDAVSYADLWQATPSAAHAPFVKHDVDLLKTHVHNLRAALKANGVPAIIGNERQFGYRLMEVA